MYDGHVQHRTKFTCAGAYGESCSTPRSLDVPWPGGMMPATRMGEDGKRARERANTSVRSIVADHGPLGNPSIYDPIHGLVGRAGDNLLVSLPLRGNKDHQPGVLPACAVAIREKPSTQGGPSRTSSRSRPRASAANRPVVLRGPRCVCMYGRRRRHDGILPYRGCGGGDCQ